ncbi:hypothetical protein RFI_10115 [Reticulomyxa filosa]|uniref:Uncharacterized protein n=1 Tax=Reticulomyxa filosa TaxID=46433 RepID=X6NL56_RETFI|nr:hypothetical protein RFI_10115 [Reticulomyxa filosa]|eukprot:ETO27015.1 hypothetical protein RFI_10115 [Reticulomyxa filosa]
MSLFTVYVEDGAKVRSLVLPEQNVERTTNERDDCYAEKKEINRQPTLPCKVKYPLVLLTGAIKYLQHQSYLEWVKYDLNLLQILFQSKLNYQVFNTYNLQNTKTELLTLNELDNFILNAIDKDNKDCDGLIFVWCGYGRSERDRETLITSDNKMKDFKEIQNDLIGKTNYFVGKPKIFIKITCKEQDDFGQVTANQKNILYRCHEDIFTICADVPRTSIINSAGSYFTEIFCRGIEGNIGKSLECIVKSIFAQISEKAIVQSVSTPRFDIYLIPRTRQHHIENDRSSIVKKDNIPQTLDLKTHWNKYWRRANVEAAKIMKKMMDGNEQGLIVVAYNTPEWKGARDNPFSFVTLMNKDNVIKKQFGSYWLYATKSELVILEDIYVDGNIYESNCKLVCKENVNITIQIFVMTKSVIDQQLQQLFSFVQWDTKIHHDIPIQLQELEEKKEECLAKELLDDSIVHLQKYLQLCIDTFGCNHPYVAISYNLLGITYFDKKQQDESIEIFEKALKIVLNNFGNNCNIITLLYNNLGGAYADKNQYDEAIAYHQKALTIESCNDGDIATTYYCLGHTYRKQSEHNKAIEFYEKALAIKLKLFGDFHEEIANLYYNLASVYQDTTQYNKAIQLYEKALLIKLKVFGASHGSVADLYYDLASVYQDAMEYENAIEYNQKALNIELVLFGKNNSKVADSYNNLGSCYEDIEQNTEAIECYKQALQIKKEIFKGPNKSIGDSLWNLGRVFNKIGETQASCKYFEESWKTYHIVFGEWDRLTVESKKRVEEHLIMNNI